MTCSYSTAYVASALRLLAQRRVAEICRLQSEFGKLSRRYRRSEPTAGSVYLRCLWESASRVIETARQISANPNHELGAALEDKLIELAQSIDEISSPDRGSQEQICALRDSLRHAIALYTGDMRQEHFNDGSLRYDCLTLLFSLHCFINALSRLDLYPRTLPL